VCCLCRMRWTQLWIQWQRHCRISTTMLPQRSFWRCRARPLTKPRRLQDECGQRFIINTCLLGCVIMTSCCTAIVLSYTRSPSAFVPSSVSTQRLATSGPILSVCSCTTLLLLKYLCVCTSLGDLLFAIARPHLWNSLQSGLAPPYLTEYSTPMSFDAGHRHLRSAYTRQLLVPRTRTSYGDRSFAVHGPVVWNSLPHDLWSTDISLATFRNRLKTFLFDVVAHLLPW